MEVLKKYNELWDGIKNKTENKNDSECKYGKHFTKIKFDTDDDLPLNKPLNLHMLTIIVRPVFEDKGNFYPQVYLDECTSYKCWTTIELIFQKKLMLIKQMHQKIAIFVTIGILKILILSMSHIFAMVVMI